MNDQEKQTQLEFCPYRMEFVPKHQLRTLPKQERKQLKQLAEKAYKELLQKVATT